MARRRTPKKVKEEIAVPEIAAERRDVMMARLLAARVSCQAAIEAIDEAGALFVNPEEDESGEERTEAIDDALQALGAAKLALESGEEHAEQMTEADWEAGEPWDDDDDDEE